MKKYYIGLIVIAAITIGLGIYIVTLGIGGKQDKQTQKRADEIAQKLNDYISDNNRIPESLQDADITDVPSTISYSKKSDERYEFCVDYKSASQGYHTSSFSEVLFNAAYSESLSVDSGSGGRSSSYEPSSLYLYGGHKKGKNCQTIKPYIRQTSTNDSLFLDSDDYCDPNGQYYEFYKDFC